MSCSEYHKAICECMKMLAAQSNTIFLGQQCASDNFYGTLEEVPMEKRREMPVAEELQTGLAIGLSLEGFLPISIYQRMDFLPRAADQIINHLGLLKIMSRYKFCPRVILRTTIGSAKPLDCGWQHKKDLVEAFKLAVPFPVMRVRTIEEVHKAYAFAITSPDPVMIIEEQDLYYV